MGCLCLTSRSSSALSGRKSTSSDVQIVKDYLMFEPLNQGRPISFMCSEIIVFADRRNICW
jgi:hypothetical protein